MYAANTVGAIAGALAFSTIVIPYLGTQDAQRLLIALSAASGMFVLGPFSWPKTAIRKNAVIDVLIAAALVFALAWRVPEVPGGLVAYGRFLATKGFTPNVLYMGEGMNAPVAVTELAGGARNFHVSGKIEASTESQDMRLQRMLGHLSALAHPQPKSVLIVGFGAGVTGSFVLHPSIEKIVICEIEPLIPEVVSQYFSNRKLQRPERSAHPRGL